MAKKVIFDYGSVYAPEPQYEFWYEVASDRFSCFIWEGYLDSLFHGILAEDLVGLQKTFPIFAQWNQAIGFAFDDIPLIVEPLPAFIEILERFELGRLTSGWSELAAIRSDLVTFLTSALEENVAVNVLKD